MTAHTYWRINVTANDGDANFLAIAEVEMRATLGGADQCTGGTATASSTNATSSPANAVDNNTSTHWITVSGVVTGWWQYQFASPVEVVEYVITCHSSNFDTAPRSWTLEYSDDGAAWTVADTRAGVTPWESDGRRGVYVVPAGAASGPFNQWMLSLTVNSGDVSTFRLSLAELEMRATAGGADQLTGGTPSASSSEASSPASNAVDNDAATRWVTVGDDMSGWWKYDFGASTTVAEYTIQAHPTVPARSPAAWKLLGSDDGVNWYVVDEQSGQTGWTNGQIRTFTIAASEAAEVRVTQQATLVMSAADSDIQVTQAVALVLAELNIADIRVTQAAALALAEFGADIRVTQAAILVLADQIPCVSHWAQCWTITRRDGEIFAFTSHDQPIQWRGITHKPCDSLASTATEMSASTGAVGNMELHGIVSDDSITEEDMLNGLFDRAFVEVWIVPWSQEQGETPIRLLAGTTGELSHGLNEFNYEVLTPGGQLQQKNIIETYTPGCRYDFGDSRCTVDTVALSVAGSVTSLPAKNGSTYATRRIFTDSTRVEVDGYFSLGTVTWITGLNVGVQREIKDFVGGQFVLWEPLLYEIGIDDEYIAKPGCTKNPDACKGYDNYINYGGYPDVPGQDAIAETPDAKG